MKVSEADLTVEAEIDSGLQQTVEIMKHRRAACNGMCHISLGPDIKWFSHN
jgi:hypothetical protein